MESTCRCNNCCNVEDVCESKPYNDHVTTISHNIELMESYDQFENELDSLMLGNVAQTELSNKYKEAPHEN